MLFSMAVVPAYAASSGTCGANLTWTLNDSGTLTISGTGDMTNYSSSSSVPWHSSSSSIKTVVIGSGVTSIGDDAFSYCSSLTSITIPDSVTSIGERAFSCCSSLTSITIPDSVTSIGGHAFSDCSSLTSITIPDSVTSIGSSAFYDTAWYSNQPNGLIYAGKVAYCYKGTMPSNTSITLANDTKGIAGGAFYSCSSLTSITIPASVTSIGSYAFSECESLASITIPAGVTSIGSGAFFDCSSLTSITIPAGVTSICESAFWGCSSLTSITIPASVTSIGSYAFYSCSSLTSITIPAGVTSIGSGAFYSCSSLTSITIPASVTSIGNYAFYYCRSLTDVYLQRGASISVGSDNTPYLNATKHYYYIVSYNTNGGTMNKTYDRIDVATQEVVLTLEVPQKKGYAFLGWSLSENCDTIDYQPGESVGIISDNITLYAVWEDIPNGVSISAKRKVNVGETFTADIQTRWGNDYNYLLSEIKFSKALILKSITPVDFKYAEQDGEITEDENYKYLTVIAQHSDEDYAEANEVYTPFRLEFELNKYCPLDSVSITHTENSLAIGDEEYPLPAVTAELGVIPKLADSIKITQNETETGIYSFSAEVLPDYTRNKTVLWSVSGKGRIATISQDGVLTVLKNGTVTVTARTTDGSNISDSKTIDVVAKSAVETITISQGEQVSNKIQFTATVLPETAENKNVIWSVNDKSIATISETGLLTMIKSGTVTVTATAQDGFGATASKTITAVNPLIATNVIISQDEQVSNKIQFTATVLPETAENKNVIWSVNDESIATISQDGLLTMIKSGTVTVTATAQGGDGIQASKTITAVNPLIATNVIISQDEQVSNKIQFTATVLPETAENKNVIWSVNDESIATISQDGLLTMIKSGTVTVTATAQGGDGIQASKTITAVNPLIATNVIISQDEQVSNKIQFTATVLPETAENKNVIWSVNDANIATISQDGLLTILQNGTVTVTATAQDGFGAKDSKSVTFTLPVTVNSLSSNAGVWDKAFEPYVYDYTVYVPKDTNAISFNGTWDTGTTKCNGGLMLKGRDKQVTLTDDITLIAITRTGVTGYTDSEYKINVVRIDDLSFVSPYEILGSSIKFNIATLILDSDNEYSLFVAGYDNNKKLVSLSKVGAESGYNELSVTSDNANDAVSYKVMLLTDDLMPYTSALEGNIAKH